MQAFKIYSLFILSVLASVAVNAAEPSESSSPPPPKKVSQMRSFGISFASWNEILTAESGTASTKVYSNHYVNNITYSQDIYTGRNGYSLNYSLIIGKATLAPSSPTYVSAEKSFYGVSFYPRYSYRKTAAITFGIGPLIMYRSLKWEAKDSVEISNSPQANIGLLGSLDFRVNERIEVNQSLGTLFIQANTYWSLGLSYNF